MRWLKTFFAFVLTLSAFASEPLTEKSMMINRQKLDAFKALELPLGQYVITGSGPLGIRNIREIGDIDLIVTDKLWDDLSIKYGVTLKEGKQSIVIREGQVEAYRRWTYRNSTEPGPTVEEMIAGADLIEGLPFMSLKHTIFCKRDLGREKDFKDIALIEEWLEKSVR